MTVSGVIHTPLPFEDTIAAAVGEGAFLGVQAQVGLALAGIRAVTGETVIGQDRPDVTIELEGRLLRLRRRRGSEEKGAQRNVRET
jgi:hypothetical protein